MEPYSYTSSYTSTHHSSSYQETERKLKSQPSYHAALHSIRRPLQQKPMMKKSIAPLPPTRPRIYQVDSINFKQVVQKLTSIPEFQSRRLQDVAPPHLDVAARTTLPQYSGKTQTPPVEFKLRPPNKLPPSTAFCDMMYETLDTKVAKLLENYGISSPSGFKLSPASLAWCSLLLGSPGTVSTLEQGTVL